MEHLEELINDVGAHCQAVLDADGKATQIKYMKGIWPEQIFACKLCSIRLDLCPVQLSFSKVEINSYFLDRN